MTLSFFRSKSRQAEAADGLPLAPLQRRRPVPAAAPAPVAAVPPAAAPKAPALPPEDDVMRRVFAELNAVLPDTPPACAAPVPPGPRPEPQPAAPAPAADPVSDEAQQPPAAADAAAPPQLPPSQEAAAAAPAGPDPSALLGDALLPAPDQPAPPAPSDAALIRTIRAAEAAVPAAAHQTSHRALLSLPKLSMPALPRLRLPRLRVGMPLPAAGTPPQRLMAAALFLPLPVIALGALTGWAGALAALAVTAGLAVLQGDLLRLAPQDAAAGPAARWLPFAEMIVLIFAGFALTGGLALGVTGWLATVLSLSVWLAQGPARAARDLACSRVPKDRLTGRVMLAMLCLPHRPSAERLIHRRLAATPDDPLSAEAGETFYDFALRALPGQAVAGYEMERALMRPRLGSRAALVHPHVTLTAATLGWIAALTLCFGALVPPVLILVALAVEAQLLMADYLAHYGLQRRTLPGGSYQTLSAAHRWGAPLAMPRLAARLTGQAVPTPGQGSAPVLPHPLPVMALRALVPPLWRADMDTRAMAMQKRGSLPA